MLDTKFPRIVGDIGNPDTFECPVIYKTVRGASPQLVVRDHAPQLLQPFIDAGNALIEEGAELISTSCGFLILFQKQLEAALPVPVLTSSLLQIGELELEFGKGNVGILTISATSLTEEIRAAADIAEGTPIGTTEDGECFTDTILNNEPDMDVERCRADNVNAALKLQEENPHIRAILLECTNMPPYAEAITKATGLPVYSILDLLASAGSDAGQSAHSRQHH